MTGWLATLERLAANRAKAGLTRGLRPRPPGDTIIDLAGNDYLGLAGHPAVIEASGKALRAYGLGATGSRPVRGSADAHAELEAGLADWFGSPAALVFSSGYLANLAAIRGLAGIYDLVVSDAYNHASLIDGCKISGLQTIVAPHHDPAGVAAILDAHPGRTVVVVTESVFSVDGDLAALADLHAVTSARGALLLVDDAHAAGILGPAGAGAVAAGVLSVHAPGPEAAVTWAEDCRDRGVAAGYFRPLSMPDGSSRLRLTLNAGVPDADFARAPTVIVECAP